MHEFAIAEAIVRATQEVVHQNGGGKVEQIRLRIGELRQVVPDALLFAFDILKQDTPLEEASLEWETVPAQVRCKTCGVVYHPKDVFWECPSCGAFGAEVTAGEELEIVAITLREGSDAD
ncbi:MAG: hydrogenase maturation nickel metallochaperone HypA [Armatimonadota bacterium]|nr:hydrogenase maturation nickel metallochaperone HypA [bacterium]MDW8320575.1 hydrogenase maturation nickel metallochaperone HypA [Armatimonadota bacterium]